jgi:hypothetical protein
VQRQHLAENLDVFRQENLLVVLGVVAALVVKGAEGGVVLDGQRVDRPA